MFKLAASIVIGIIILVVLIATPILISLRRQGEAMYEKYDSFTKKVLNQGFSLQPHPVKAEFQTLHSWRFLKLFKIANNVCQTVCVLNYNF